ncbi:archaellin/type IV pilin N-terminal domain-containing protein [Candidatus Nitrosotenuis sp. DW1]|uniref:archaellin/type IV pilin N-terminal domain-containing protein n=1 Tax=Candidatus Nitrosotenuis sp. DW1 TaxID=2259672 RepID=UPI0015C7A3EE|nr:archaellin/type IV pilin N-terminal domain-containing protein [Candidatus Nitrosotenuis sp. DW1]QLH08190.1 flagellin [Candidatus Nitrosotenuis sp. DW1]
MNLIRKGHRKSHRGVIGVESAIVMIAFVIVAAALAFVVLNMGFSTTQKAKTTIVSGLGEASSSLQISGKVKGIGCTSSTKGCSTPYLNATIIPLKIASGGDSVNLQNSTASVKYISNSKSFDNIYKGPLAASTTYNNATAAFNAAVTASVGGFVNAAVNPVTKSLPSQTVAIVYWAVTGNTNAILDDGEHAVLAIAYGNNDRPAALDKIRVEVVTPTGAALSVERNVPIITNTIVDLG